MSLRSPHESTLDGSSVHLGPQRVGGDDPMVSALALLWSHEEPARVGEVFCLPRGAVDVPFTIGRADTAEAGGALPLVLQQLRPGSRVDTGPLRDARISRRHLGVRLVADGNLLIERLGRGAVRINGHEIDEALAAPGDIITADGRFALLYTERPASWPKAQVWPRPFRFGGPDADGLVGESPAAWELRRQIAVLALLGQHVLVHGPSGAGKERIVRALHAASPRAGRPLVSRNAATIPESLIDAELFGNLRDYPNPGMPERVGLLGEADRGTLFLDEIGELPHALQVRLLRVMDAGDYQRLGEARRRTCDLRLVGATNRDPSELKHDLLARFVHRIRAPGFDERRDDIPLLARHLAGEIARAHPELGGRSYIAAGEPLFAPELVAALVRRTYVGHVRELATIVWRGLTEGEGRLIDVTSERAPPSPPPLVAEPFTIPESLTRDEVVAALAACDGVRERAWRHLRLHSRHQLKRLLKRFDIA
ncbi:MAG: sigma-54-dependent Fis family transcriptional regulator [Nannocystis sp.]|nr:sigma-54-dependent Fis family transcriptional regulator [Nannocystis sp.]